ncbi:hypothetical protein [Oceanobacillus indicireducens]|uniref:Uncharacterized protein n=1 Tax=Oceanobacillus indicireducens TaxID=1004261 RepID=A0A917XYH3_9BACI|nr:hypothetical protein [Oceanobacillus indicireducens]GGN59481.1 hypothetical protein GCM10007971_22660 [Oceanobacillus indicireducens]
MTDQLQVAKEWLGDINVILSNQKTKEDYEYGKKRADALGHLINRVEELESAIATGQHVSNLMQKKIERYKQALEFYADDESWTLYDHHGRTQLGLDGGRKARQALKGESE